MPDEGNISRIETIPKNYWKQFADASETGEEFIANLKKELLGLSELPRDPIEACYAVRAYLIEKGFTYNDKIFTLDKLAETKSGNCLGLALLFGAILEDNGYNPKFEIVLTPKDAVYERELNLLNALNRGDYFSYDNPPPVPEKQADHPQLRFAPLEHPAIIIFDGRRFETTSLDNETDPEVKYEAELFRPVSYSEVTSGVYLDRAKRLLDEGEKNYADIKILIEQSLTLWESNREAYAFLWEVATAANDNATADEAKKKYLKIGGED